MWELVARTDPYKENKIYDIPRLVVSGVRPEIPKDIVPDYSALMCRCWSQDPDNRPSFIELDRIFTEISSRIDDKGNYQAENSEVVVVNQ